MAKKPKKLKEEIETYRQRIIEHEEKIKENIETGERLESITPMEQEIRNFEAEIKKRETRISIRKKKGTKGKK